jgi:hypothetical protein
MVGQTRNSHSSWPALRQEPAWSTTRLVPSRLRDAWDPRGDEERVGRHDQSDDRGEDQTVLVEKTAIATAAYCMAVSLKITLRGSPRLLLRFG